jgi:ribosomal protein S18
MKGLNPLKKTQKKGKGKRSFSQKTSSSGPHVLSWVQLLVSVKKKRSHQSEHSNPKTPFNYFSSQKKYVDTFNVKPPLEPLIIPNKKKKEILILSEKPNLLSYNRRIVNYKNNSLLQRYIGLGGQILPRRQTSLTAKEQRYIAKNIKRARVFSLLPFFNKEKGYFR